jgi:hypothetical protein
MNQQIESGNEIDQLTEVCKELLPNGEVQEINPFLYDTETFGAPEISNVLGWAGYSATETNIEVTTLRNFLSPMTAFLPEHGIAEKAIAKRFLQFQNALESMMDSIRVIKIRDKKSESIILGETSKGHCAGLRIHRDFSVGI